MTQDLEVEARADWRNPFAEAAPSSPQSEATAVGFTPWSESATPFSEASALVPESQSEQQFADAFGELRDEGFDEAVANLAEETEQAVVDRFASEAPTAAAERERYADAQLAPVRFEAHQYLESLGRGLEGLDLASLAPEQLDEVLDRFDPQSGELTPAGEEFIGGLIRKAKSAVKFVANTAKKIGGKVLGTVIGPVLARLRGLINPLLRRVLSFAIGRLPAALQPVARKLAARFTSEVGEDEANDEAPVSPANLTDVEALTEGFDAALAEAIVTGSNEGVYETYEANDAETGIEGRELEQLATARGMLIDQLRTAGDEENLGPAIEQFVPALLGALRLGINLIGRPKVVNFLARYVGQLIARWVGPTLSSPLSNAIVDTGLRLVTLEGEAGEARNGEAGPVALASVIEDTVRRLAESEDYVFEHEDLTQLATAEAFGQAVATHFPARMVRTDLQQAPSLGGTFVARRPRGIRTYRKYSRAPEVEITAQIADALPTFGGTTLGAALRAAGVSFPIRARLHIYQSAVGTTLARITRDDRAAAGNRSGQGYVVSTNIHPLTPAAAGLLLREPRLGVAVPSRYLRSRRRIAVGQRFYALEASGESAAPALAAAITRQAAERTTPTRAWTVVNLRRSRITVGFYLSETDAQSIAAAVRQGRGATALLQALVTTYRAAAHGAHGHVRIVQEDHEDFDNFVEEIGRWAPRRFIGSLRKRLRAWVLPALADWIRNNGEAFARAAAHPDPGVTIRVRLTGVPGLDMLGPNVAVGAISGALSALRGKPAISIVVTPGRRRQ